jgi:phage shock protein PspC (stress-responsive transcriptional regulator)
MTTDCTRALDALRLALEAGTALAPESLAHLQGCPACRANLDVALRGLEAGPSGVPAADPARAEAEVRRHHRRRLLWRSLGAAAALAAVTLGLLGSLGVLRGGTLVLTLLVLGLVPWLAVAWWLVRLPGRIGLTKRLGPGRQLSGVCLGLAYRTGTPVWGWRLGFVGLCLLPGLGHAAGLWLYLLLDLIMPIDPEDRPNLLRFRLARWWRGLRARAA